MAYSVSNGDIISLSKSGRTPQSMTTSVPLHTFTGDLDPIQLWKTQPAVRTVIDFLAATQAGIPLNLYRVVNETDRQRIRSGPVASALRRPGNRVTSFNLRRDLLTDRLIFDRFVVFKHFPSPGTLELHRIPAQLTAIIITALGQPTGVRVTFPASNRHYDLPLSEIVFDVGYSPLIGQELNQGYSPLFTLRDLAEEMLASGKYRREMWKNGAQIPAVITRPATAAKSGWSEAERVRFLNDLARYKPGGGKEAGMPLLEDGMEIKKVDVFSPADTQYIEVRKLALAEAASAFRVPPELVGAREGN